MRLGKARLPSRTGKGEWCALRGFTQDLELNRQRLLTDGAADVGEYVVGVRTNEPDRAHHDHQNHSQHHRILGDILTTVIVPKFLQYVCHRLRLLKKSS